MKSSANPLSALGEQYINRGLRSDHEGVDSNFWQYQASLVRNALELMYPGQDDALDEAAAKAFQRAESGDYQTYSVYSNPMVILNNISKIMQKNGHTAAMGGHEAVRSIDKNYQSKMNQAVSAHKKSDDADDGDGFFEMIVPMALSFFGAPYLTGLMTPSLGAVGASVASGAITGGLSSAITAGVS